MNGDPSSAVGVPRPRFTVPKLPPLPPLPPPQPEGSDENVSPASSLESPRPQSARQPRAPFSPRPAPLSAHNSPRLTVKEGWLERLARDTPRDRRVSSVSSEELSLSPGDTAYAPPSFGVPAAVLAQAHVNPGALALPPEIALELAKNVEWVAERSAGMPEGLKVSAATRVWRQLTPRRRA